MTSARRKSAFSLVELVIVMIIVGMLAAMAIPRFAGATVRQRADAAARRLVADLNMAGRHAYQTGSSQTVVFNLTDHSYQMPGLIDPQRPGQEYVIELMDEPYLTRLVSVDFSGFEKVTFDGYGVPDNGGTIVIAAGDEKRTISVDADTGEAYLP